MSAIFPKAGTSQSQRTFNVAVALLSAVAAAQICAALVLYWRQHHRAPEPSATVVTEAKTQGAPVPTLRYTEQSQPGAMATESATPAAAPAQSNSRADVLLQNAKKFRARGDTTTAIAKLQQATALEPANAEILAELALTYESIQLYDRSSEAWRRLLSLGVAVGPLYELAEMKLRVGAPERTNPSVAGSVPANGNDSIPDGSAFGISQIEQVTENDPEAKTRIRLRISVKVRPNTPIDHRKVKIQVFFYDVVDNDQVALTDADVNYEWVTPGHDWANTDTEILDVTYFRPKQSGSNAAAEVEVPDSVEKAKLAKKRKSQIEPLPTKSDGVHAYLGYIVRVYYKDQLQAVRAEPTRLLNLFPPPYTASAQ